MCKTFRTYLLFSASVVVWLTGSLSLHGEEYRTWTDITGKHKMEAKFLSVENDKVVLLGKDGKNISILISKLSEKDRGYLEAKVGESPFQVVEGPTPTTVAKNSVGAPSNKSNPVPTTPLPTDSGSSSPVAATAAPKELKVDFQSVTQLVLMEGGWEVKPDSAEGPAPTFKAFDLPPSKIEREQITRIVSNPRAKRLAVSYSPNDPFKKERNGVTRIVVVDLTTGKISGNAGGAGRWEAMALHDDGETIVIRNKTEGTELGQLGTVKIVGNKMIPIDLWRPYESSSKEAKDKEVTFAEFANDGKLVTASQDGNVVVWNFATKEPVSRFDYHGACTPSMSPNRKQLGFSGGDLVGFFDIDSGEIKGLKKAPGINYWVKSAYSPSGKRFAASNLNKLMVWEVESGEVLFEGAFDGIQLAQGLQFPDENYLLLSNDYLVELKNRIKLWQFIGTNHMTHYGSTPVFGVNHSGAVRLMPTALPTPEATKMLETALKQPDLFVWRKGVDVRLDVSQVPPEFQGEVMKALQEQVSKMGCRPNPNAKVTLKASISGPKAEAVSYFFGGSFVLQQYQSTLAIDYGGVSIWSAGANNTPGAISRGSKEEMQKQIDEAGQRPNIRFFAGASLPQFLQKPQAKGASGNRQTIGVSRVTPSGFQTEK